MSTREKQIVGCSCLFVTIVCIFSLLFILAGASHFGMNVGDQNSYDFASNASMVGYPDTADTTEAKLCLNKYIETQVPTSPLRDKAENFISSGKAGTVNPALLVAIGQQESNLGTSGRDGISKNNYYGKMAEKKVLQTFASWEDAIADQGPYMKRMYLDDGLTTIPQIGGRYAPVGADNDPNNLNKNWIPRVTHFYDAITTQCPEFSNGNITAIANATECGKKILEHVALYNGTTYWCNSKNCKGTPGKYSSHCGPVSPTGPLPGMHLDCSGLVSRVYRELGLFSENYCFYTGMVSEMARQSLLIVEISPEDIQPGDFIFSKGTRAGHVVIYVSGDPKGRFKAWQSGGDCDNTTCLGTRTGGDRWSQRYFRAKKCVESK